MACFKDKETKMGLDQYAYSRTADEMQIFDGEAIPDFQWRKHPKLHRFMEELWKTREANDGEEFNNIAVRLHYEDIALLKSLVVKNKLKQDFSLVTNIKMKPPNYITNKIFSFVIGRLMR